MRRFFSNEALPKYWPYLPNHSSGSVEGRHVYCGVVSVGAAIGINLNPALRRLVRLQTLASNDDKTGGFRVGVAHACCPDSFPRKTIISSETAQSLDHSQFAPPKSSSQTPEPILNFISSQKKTISSTYNAYRSGLWPTSGDVPRSRTTPDH